MLFPEQRLTSCKHDSIVLVTDMATAENGHDYTTASPTDGFLSTARIEPAPIAKRLGRLRLCYCSPVYNTKNRVICTRAVQDRIQGSSDRAILNQQKGKI